MRGQLVATDVACEVQGGPDRRLVFVLTPDGLQVSIRSRLRSVSMVLSKRAVRQAGDLLVDGVPFCNIDSTDSWAGRLGDSVFVVANGATGTRVVIDLGRTRMSCRLPDSATRLIGLWLREAAKDMA